MKRLVILSLCLLTLTSCSDVKQTTGQFHETIQATDINGNTDTYYQFKSNDNEVWWQLTAEEIGFIPNANTEYVLTYDNNGTTDCDCSAECECEIYDDIFLRIERK